MLAALANIFRITELRQKVLFTLAMFIVFRAGTHIPVPGVNASVIEQLFRSGNLFGLLDMFSGGALSKFSIFAMSITPYINASIILQLLKVVVPTLEQWSKEGEEGFKKTTKLTRMLTVALAFIQACGMAYGLKMAINNPGIFSILLIALTLTAGTVFLMWIGEQITARGVGNGISLIIFAGIVSRLPDGLKVIFQYLQAGTVSLLNVILFAAIALAMVVFVIIISEGIRKIPVQYAKRVVGRKQYGGQSTHIPVKVCMSGVMPIIFAMSFMSLPSTIGMFKGPYADPDGFWQRFYNGFLNFFSTTSGWYALIYFVLIIAFNYFYVSMQYNPIEIANQLRQNNGGIPGIRPGKPTSDYIQRVLSKITLVGAFFLGIIAIFPIILGMFDNNLRSLSMGGTTVLIVVSVALETVRTLESQMMMRHHKGFLE